MKNKSQQDKNDPFEIEALRNKLAQEGKKEEFKDLYIKPYPEIKNKNTKSFWNSHFGKELGLKDQDEMTKDKIKKIVKLLPDERINILDLGFGQGYFEEMLEEKHGKYKLHGIDISSTAVQRASRKFKGMFIQGDIKEVDKYYKKNKFDYVVALELIEHIVPKNILGFYEVINSLIKKDGTLIISTPLNEGLRSSKKNPSGHVRDYQPAVIKMELELSGFKILETHQLYAFKAHYKFKKILARIFPWKWKPNNIIVVARKI